MIEYKTKIINNEFYYFVAIFEKQYVKFHSNRYTNSQSLTIGWLGDEIYELGEYLKSSTPQANDHFPFIMRNGEIEYFQISPNMEQKYGLKFLDLVECTNTKYNKHKGIVIGEHIIMGQHNIFFWIQGESGASYYSYYEGFLNGLDYGIHKLEQQIPFNEFGLKKLGPGIPSLAYKVQIVIKDTLKKNEKIIWNLSCFPYNTNFMYEGSVSDMIREKLIEQTRSSNDQSTLANLVSLPKDQRLYLFGSDYQNLYKLFSFPPKEDPFMKWLCKFFKDWYAPANTYIKSRFDIRRLF